MPLVSSTSKLRSSVHSPLSLMLGGVSGCGMGRSSGTSCMHTMALVLHPSINLSCHMAFLSMSWTLTSFLTLTGFSTSTGFSTIPSSTSMCSLSSGSTALELSCSCSLGRFSLTSTLRGETCWAAPNAASAPSLLLASVSPFSSLSLIGGSTDNLLGFASNSCVSSLLDASIGFLVGIGIGVGSRKVVAR
ncbi:hypothetical protein BKA83DRAFT_4273919 [Pisolithus microcarpus]|nr:hypothetical protein BKA83DRAFT_4273919 [Pisolithus microcarpus]